eukprot:GILK01011429.1.p1 GENE.GILK01011429.1~~GILK01011429.1.p1  ORF type:complete len:1046 (-),score=125.85 GILK01011429.1:70-3090(-)
MAKYVSLETAPPDSTVRSPIVNIEATPTVQKVVADLELELIELFIVLVPLARTQDRQHPTIFESILKSLLWVETTKVWVGRQFQSESVYESNARTTLAFFELFEVILRTSTRTAEGPCDVNAFVESYPAVLAYAADFAEKKALNTILVPSNGFFSACFILTFAAEHQDKFKSHDSLDLKFVTMSEAFKKVLSRFLTTMSDRPIHALCIQSMSQVCSSILKFFNVRDKLCDSEDKKQVVHIVSDKGQVVHIVSERLQVGKIVSKVKSTLLDKDEWSVSQKLHGLDLLFRLRRYDAFFEKPYNSALMSLILSYFKEPGAPLIIRLATDLSGPVAKDPRPLFVQSLIMFCLGALSHMSQLPELTGDMNNSYLLISAAVARIIVLLNEKNSIKPADFADSDWNRLITNWFDNIATCCYWICDKMRKDPENIQPVGILPLILSLARSCFQTAQVLQDKGENKGGNQRAESDAFFAWVNEIKGKERSTTISYMGAMTIANIHQMQSQKPEGLYERLVFPPSTGEMESRAAYETMQKFRTPCFRSDEIADQLTKWEEICKELDSLGKGGESSSCGTVREEKNKDTSSELETVGEENKEKEDQTIKQPDLITFMLHIIDKQDYINKYLKRAQWERACRIQFAALQQARKQKRVIQTEILARGDSSLARTEQLRKTSDNKLRIRMGRSTVMSNWTQLEASVFQLISPADETLQESTIYEGRRTAQSAKKSIDKSQVADAILIETEEQLLVAVPPGKDTVYLHLSTSGLLFLFVRLPMHPLAHKSVDDIDTVFIQPFWMNKFSGTAFLYFFIDLKYACRATVLERIVDIVKNMVSKSKDESKLFPEESSNAETFTKLLDLKPPPTVDGETDPIFAKLLRQVPRHLRRNIRKAHQLALDARDARNKLNPTPPPARSQQERPPSEISRIVLKPLSFDRNRTSSEPGPYHPDLGRGQRSVSLDCHGMNPMSFSVPRSPSHEIETAIAGLKFTGRLPVPGNGCPPINEHESSSYDTNVED